MATLEDTNDLAQNLIRCILAACHTQDLDAVRGLEGIRLLHLFRYKEALPHLQRLAAAR